MSALIIGKLRRNKKLICVLLSLTVSAVLYLAQNELRIKPCRAYAEESHEISAVIIDTPTVSSGGNYGYLIKTQTIDGKNEKIRMMLYTSYDICASPYDVVTFRTKPFIFPADNESGLEYFRSKRIYLGAYTGSSVRVFQPDKKPLISYFPIRKAKSEKNIREFLSGDYAEFAVSILFGDKTYLSDSAKENFRFAGLSHIMAVSGLHLSVWIMGLHLLLVRLRLDEKTCGALCVFASLCLVCFCSFSVSVIRAAVMLSAYLIAPFFSRRGDSFNSLGLSAVLICSVNPCAVGDISFLLSFFATLGIIVLSEYFPPVLRREETDSALKNIGLKLLTALCVCVSACVFTAPLLLRYFSSVCIWSVISNPAVSFAVAPCVLLAGALSVCPKINIISHPIKYALLCLEKYIFFITEKTASLPFAGLMCNNSVIKCVVCAFTVLGIFTLYSVKKKKITLESAIITAALLICVCR